MNAALGTGAIAAGFAASLLGFVNLVFALIGRRPRYVRMGTIYAWVVVGASVFAFAVMERALAQRDYRLAYVQKVGSSRTPRLFNIAALWSSLEGSILLWALILAGYLTLVLVRFRGRRNDPLVGWATATMLAVCTFFFLLMLGPANPFRTALIPINFIDGPGPNALLQNHPLMLFHPPVLYLGYVGFTVPFAFAIAALVTGRVGEGWLLETRRWTLVAWAFLTLGIVLGSWWSYEVLGWGGFWAWDAVENASLLPWLTGTAYLHSVLVQERRGMLRVWNLSLLAATFSLTILGTFLTRSGVVDSVHAFTNSRIGPYLLAFFAVVVAVSLGLIGWRGDRLRSPGTIDSPLSREGAFLANNVLFAAFAFVVLLGTVFPLIGEALNGRKLTVGRPFFDSMATPLGLALLTLMAIAPALPWRKASTELLRDRLFWPAWCAAGALAVAVVVGGRGLTTMIAFALGGFAAGAALRQLVLATRRQGWRGLVGRANGGMIVHLGVIIIAVALAAANSHQRTAELRLKPGQSATVLGHTFTYNGVAHTEDKTTAQLKARVLVDGKREYRPAQTVFLASGTLVPTPSVRTGFASDLYLTLENRPADDGDAIIKVLVMPLALWLWVGGLVMFGGTFLAAFPGRNRRRPTAPVSAASAPTVVDDDREPALAGGTLNLAAETAATARGAFDV